MYSLGSVTPTLRELMQVRLPIGVTALPIKEVTREAEGARAYS
jgi:hypothetical protein